MVIEIVNIIMLWINAYPPNGGIYNTITTCIFYTGIKIDYRKYNRVDFGDYRQTNEDESPTNTM